MHWSSSAIASLPSLFNYVEGRAPRPDTHAVADIQAYGVDYMYGVIQVWSLCSNNQLSKCSNVLYFVIPVRCTYKIFIPSSFTTALAIDIKFITLKTLKLST